MYNRKIRKENIKIQNQLNKIHTMLDGENLFQKDSVYADNNCNFNKVFE